MNHENWKRYVYYGLTRSIPTYIYTFFGDQTRYIVKSSPNVTNTVIENPISQLLISYQCAAKYVCNLIINIFHSNYYFRCDLDHTLIVLYITYVVRIEFLGDFVFELLMSHSFYNLSSHPMMTDYHSSLPLDSYWQHQRSCPFQVRMYLVSMLKMVSR